MRYSQLQDALTDLLDAVVAARPTRKPMTTKRLKNMITTASGQWRCVLQQGGGVCLVQTLTGDTIHNRKRSTHVDYEKGNQEVGALIAEHELPAFIDPVRMHHGASGCKQLHHADEGTGRTKANAYSVHGSNGILLHQDDDQGSRHLEGFIRGQHTAKRPQSGPARILE